MLNAAYSCPSGIDCRHWSIKQIQYRHQKMQDNGEQNIAQCNHLTLQLGVHKGSFLNAWSTVIFLYPLLPQHPPISGITPLNLLQQYLLPAHKGCFVDVFRGLLVTKVRICHFCLQFVQLILRKVVETVEAKMQQIRFQLRLCPLPRPH